MVFLSIQSLIEKTTELQIFYYYYYEKSILEINGGILPILGGVAAAIADYAGQVAGDR